MSLPQQWMQLVRLVITAVFVVAAMMLAMARWVFCGSKRLRPGPELSLAPHVKRVEGKANGRSVLIEGSAGSGRSFLAESIAMQFEKVERVFWRKRRGDEDDDEGKMKLILQKSDVMLLIEDMDEITEGQVAAFRAARCTLIITTSSSFDSTIKSIFDEVLRCGPLSASSIFRHLPEHMAVSMRKAIVTSAGAAVSVSHMQLIISACQFGFEAECELSRGVDPVCIIFEHLPERPKRVSNTIAVFSPPIPERLIESTSEFADDLIVLEEMKLLVACAGPLPGRHFSLAPSALSHLRRRSSPSNLILAAESIRQCVLSPKSSTEHPLMTRLLIQQGEALAEQFSEAIFMSDDSGQHVVPLALCELLTLIGTLYIRAQRPEKAIESLKMSLGLLNTLPTDCSSNCMSHTLHIMSSVYAWQGDAPRQHRALSSAMAIAPFSSAQLPESLQAILASPAPVSSTTRRRPYTLPVKTIHEMGEVDVLPFCKTA